MGRYSDEELDIILNETMKCNAGPEGSLNVILKEKLTEKMEVSKNRGVSMWWLPGFAGSVLTFVTTGLLSFFVLDTTILTLLMLYVVASNICVWGLTIIGVKKFGLVREAVIK
jgi:hypothetical protein